MRAVFVLIILMIVGCGIKTTPNKSMSKVDSLRVENHILKTKIIKLKQEKKLLEDLLEVKKDLLNIKKEL